MLQQQGGRLAEAPGALQGLEPLLQASGLGRPRRAAAEALTSSAPAEEALGEAA